MTAWNVLIMHSTLPSGTAWEHLNAQEAGGTGVVVNDGVVVELALDPLTLEVLMQDVEAEVADEPIVIEIEDSPVEVSLVADPIEMEIV